MKLTKQFWVLHQDGAILNKDYRDIQSGECNVGAGILSAEFDTIEDLEAYVMKNSLYLQDEKNISNSIDML